MGKSFIWIFMLIGATVGSFITFPGGGGLFSASSILWSTVGGIIGIIVGYQFQQCFGS